MNEILEQFKQPEFINTIIIMLLTWIGLFIKAFIDAVKPGKPKTITQRMVLGIIRKLLNKVSPEHLGQRAALKVNPDSPNARRISDNKPFTKDDAKVLNRAVLEARSNSQPHGKNDGGWDFI